MGLIVCKFGGTSLSGATELKIVKNVITSDTRRVVVVSAPGRRFSGDQKVTDLLISLHKLVNNPDEFREGWRGIEERFLRTASAEISDFTKTVLAEVCEECLTQNSYDFTVSRGEYISARVFAFMTNRTFVDAKDLIVFDDIGVDLDETQVRFRAAEQEHKAFVMPGFYGSYSGAIKLFKRGGSDISGAIAAYCLRADLYENWTDVNGFMTADPNKDTNAQTIFRLSFDDARRLSESGAAVLEAAAIDYAQRGNIPIMIRNTFNPSFGGTVICDESTPTPMDNTQSVTGQFPVASLEVSGRGRLSFAGHDTVELAKKYGTPLMLVDSEGIRKQAKTFLSAARKHFGENAQVLYASKALAFSGLYKLVAEEGLCIDVVSIGEIYTALRAGFDPARMYFHGNNKTREEIEYAIASGVGCFVADNPYEIELINASAAAKKIKQRILIRITPGINPHTHEAVKTGKVDSKFGVAIATGQAEDCVKMALKQKNIQLLGYHCHIGSQIFDSRPFVSAADIMLEFCADMDARLGFVAEVLNLGGGFGVRYTVSQPAPDYGKIIAEIAAKVDEKCEELDINRPQILFEPGRAIVAGAGLTLYTVGGVKQIPGYKNYVPIDGGMTDNPRYALYKSPYTVLLANRVNDPADFRCTIAGRCCESGDMIQEDVLIPRPNAGEVLAVAVTGAYNYSMASNYNRFGRPAVVMLGKDKDTLAVKRESLDDIVRNDLEI